MLLEEIGGAEVRGNKYGRFLLVRREFDPARLREIGEYIAENTYNLEARSLRESFSSFYPDAAGVYRKNMVFFDVESCGLDFNDPLFMISMSYFINGDIETDILFARDYSEERPMLRHFLTFAAKYRSEGNCLFLTYNGTSFDIPRLNERMKQSALTFNGCESFKDFVNGHHYDLVKAVRNLKETGKIRKLPDCSLQTLERVLFGHIRRRDLSGKAIPDAYHEYVFGRQKDEYDAEGKIIRGKPVDREKAAERMAGAINHGELDTLGLVALVAYLGQRDSNGEFPEAWDEVEPEEIEEEEESDLPF